MGELRRIVCQKKYFLSVLLLLTLNLLLFQYFQKDTLELFKSEGAEKTIQAEWLEEQRTAKEEFFENIEHLRERSESLSEISIFSKEDTFSNKNIWKTQEDFERIENVTIDIAHSDEAVSAFLRSMSFSLTS